MGKVIFYKDVLKRLTATATTIEQVPPGKIFMVLKLLEWKKNEELKRVTNHDFHY